MCLRRGLPSFKIKCFLISWSAEQLPIPCKDEKGIMEFKELRPMNLRIYYNYRSSNLLSPISSGWFQLMKLFLHHCSQLLVPPKNFLFGSLLYPFLAILVWDCTLLNISYMVFQTNHLKDTQDSCECKSSCSPVPQIGSETSLDATTHLSRHYVVQLLLWWKHFSLHLRLPSPAVGGTQAVQQKEATACSLAQSLRLSENMKV